jgi:hypothetical protein
MVLKTLLEKGNNQVEVVELSIIKGYISFTYNGKKGRVFEIKGKPIPIIRSFQDKGWKLIETKKCMEKIIPNGIVQIDHHF